MKVILLKSVPKLGKANDIVDVPDGYAQNALFPKKLAQVATPQAIAAIKANLQNKETQKQIQHDLLDRAVASIKDASVVYTAKTNEKGNLFSKIGPADIATFLMHTTRISIDPKHLRIVEGVIKHTGTYTIEVADGAYRTTFELVVVAQ